MKRRVRLNGKKQKELFVGLSKKFGGLRLVSKNFSISYSTIRNYASGDRTLPEELFFKIIKELKLSKKGLAFEYLDENWGRIIGAKRGMKALEKKYPDKIKEWRRSAIKNSAENRLKKFSVPQIDEKFAEFVGAYIGDGTLTKYFIRITGDYRYDLPYFEYLNKILYNLFGIKGKIYRDAGVNTANLVIFSKRLCNYFVEELGLKIGHKIRNNSIIPEVIAKDNLLFLACLRGLMDTDGCISRRGRNGEQFTVTFFSANPNLTNQIYNLSRNYGFFTFVSKDETTLGTNSNEKIIDYFKLVGSSNLRHIVRFCERFKNKNTIYQKDVANYYQKDLYRDINLPFKLDNAALSSIG